jgi:hypothetical protein
MDGLVKTPVTHAQKCARDQMQGIHLRRKQERAIAVAERLKQREDNYQWGQKQWWLPRFIKPRRYTIQQVDDEKHHVDKEVSLYHHVYDLFAAEFNLCMQVLVMCDILNDGYVYLSPAQCGALTTYRFDLSDELFARKIKDAENGR